MEKLINTYGFELGKIMEDAKVNGNEKFYACIEKSVKNLQTIYDVIAQKHSATSDAEYWNIDGEYVENLLVK